jgi:hypothetical protein
MIPGGGAKVSIFTFNVGLPCGKEVKIKTNALDGGRPTGCEPRRAGRNGGSGTGEVNDYSG